MNKQQERDHRKVMQKLARVNKGLARIAANLDRSSKLLAEARKRHPKNSKHLVMPVLCPRCRAKLLKQSPDDFWKRVRRINRLLGRSDRRRRKAKGGA